MFLVVAHAVQQPENEWAILYQRLVKAKCPYDERTRSYKGKMRVVGPHRWPDDLGHVRIAEARCRGSGKGWACQGATTTHLVRPGSSQKAQSGGIPARQTLNARNQDTPTSPTSTLMRFSHSSHIPGRWSHPHSQLAFSLFTPVTLLAGQLATEVLLGVLEQAALSGMIHWNAPHRAADTSIDQSWGQAKGAALVCRSFAKRTFRRSYGMYTAAS